MNSEKAIKRLQRLKVELKHWKDDERDKAIDLGTEALARCQHARKETNFVGPGLLPSETEE